MTTIEAQLAVNLLATDAATAHTAFGSCAICRRSIARSERYALLVPGGRAAHLPCISLAAGAMTTGRQMVIR